MDSYVIPQQAPQRIISALRDLGLRPMGSLVTIVELEKWMDARPGELDEILRAMEAQGQVICAPNSGAVKVVSLARKSDCPRM